MLPSAKLWSTDTPAPAARVNETAQAPYHRFLLLIVGLHCLLIAGNG
jgi:hypothetical protein